MIELQNPWWRGREHIEEDEDFARWKASSIKWVPPLLNKIGLEPYALHFVTGPRQVGKTTLLKLLVKQLAFPR
jgi:predicted AAA+ superfamily ATPase